jgi:hypothetical protein
MKGKSTLSGTALLPFRGFQRTRNFVISRYHGDRFGYCHQVGQITLTNAKQLLQDDLASNELTLNFAYLS